MSWWRSSSTNCHVEPQKQKGCSCSDDAMGFEILANISGITGPDMGNISVIFLLHYGSIPVLPLKNSDPLQ